VIARFLLVVVSVLTLSHSAAAQVHVIISGGFRGAYEALVPDFEKTSNIKVTATSGASIGNGPATIPNQIRNGAAADVVILAREGLNELVAEHRIVAGSDVDLARSLIGMIVRAGSPKPDISTVDAFTQTLLRAQSIAVSTSASGVYLTTKLFPRLGLGDAMTRKVVMSDAGAAAVGTGGAEIGLQQVSEVLRHARNSSARYPRSCSSRPCSPRPSSPAPRTRRRRDGCLRIFRRRRPPTRSGRAAWSRWRVAE